MSHHPPEPGRRVFYLTTPIYYVNATPHLGHAYTTIVADAVCRYHRLLGDEVFFLTGTDEHGDKIAQAAARAGETPSAYTDRIAQAFRTQWDRLGITYDDFIRTTEPRHTAVVQEILRRLWDAGEIYFGKYGGPYCFGCERFYTEKEIVEGRCPDHQTPLTFLEEENYFFRMSRHQAWLQDQLAAHPELISPERYRNEVLGFLREPLQDLSISRPRTRLEWGIPLPFDDRFVTYVWFDALINYVSALGPLDGPRTAGWWPHVRHLIGKDILKPHAIYWPTMLRAAGLPVFARLMVHGFWGLGGGKMSKSVGNVVEALALAERYGHDAFRYFLLREMPFGLDASFSEEALVTRLNADLANDLGNLVARATTLMAARDGGGDHVAFAPEDEAVASAFDATRERVDRAMEEFQIHRALTEIWQFIGTVNRYVDTTQPWALARDPAQRGRLDAVLATLGDALSCLGVILSPFLPTAAARIREALGTSGPPRLEDALPGRRRPLPRTSRLSGLFPRSESGPAPAPAVAAPRPAAQIAAVAERVTIEEFRRLDLRVAEVVDAERVPKSKKLLKLTVRLGEETRVLVAGIAEHYSPDELRGRRVVVLANLAPATLMGVTSQGMVLAGSEGPTLALVTTDRDVPLGARVS